MGKQKYSTEQAKHWLIWLSQSMVKNSQTVFLIERMQPTLLRTKIQRWMYRGEIWLTSGLAYFLPSWILLLLISIAVIVIKIITNPESCSKKLAYIKIDCIIFITIDSDKLLRI